MFLETKISNTIKFVNSEEYSEFKPVKIHLEIDLVYDTRSIFKWILTGLNSEYSSELTNFIVFKRGW